MNQVVHVEQKSDQSPQAVWERLVDTAQWPMWADFEHAQLERPGHDHPEGVGAIRVFRRGRWSSREEVVAFEPTNHFGYILLSGLPLRTYRADVNIVPSASGSAITWHSEFQPKVPGTGWLFRLGLQRFIADTARRLGQAEAH
jgi:Polyketide cyclase / dehydrase and lipid transport